MFYYYMPEIWRQMAPPYEWYKVSSHGRIQSIKTRRLLSPGLLAGHPVVCLTKTKFNSSQKRVSWMVFNTFCGTAKIIAHYDNRNTNNHYMNLVDATKYQQPPAPLPKKVLDDIVTFYYEFEDSKLVKEAIRYKYYFIISQREIHRIVRGRAYRKETRIAPRSLNAAKGITSGQDDFDDVFG